MAGSGGRIPGSTVGHRGGFARRVITVGHAKTSSGTGPRFQSTAIWLTVLSTHALWCSDQFGTRRLHTNCSVRQALSNRSHEVYNDVEDCLGVWGSIRDETVVKFWLHHLRHTALTKMAEGGAAMMERYSHIRMAAKREAVDALKFRPREAKTTEGAAKDSTKVAPLPLLN